MSNDLPGLGPALSQAQQRSNLLWGCGVRVQSGRRWRGCPGRPITWEHAPMLKTLDLFLN